MYVYLMNITENDKNPGYPGTADRIFPHPGTWPFFILEGIFWKLWQFMECVWGRSTCLECLGERSSIGNGMYARKPLGIVTDAVEH